MELVSNILIIFTLLITFITLMYKREWLYYALFSSVAFLMVGEFLISQSKETVLVTMILISNYLAVVDLISRSLMYKSIPMKSRVITVGLFLGLSVLLLVFFLSFVPQSELTFEMKKVDFMLLLMVIFIVLLQLKQKKEKEEL